LIVITSAWNPSGAVQDRMSGEQLKGEAARAETFEGWVRTLQRLVATGAHVVVSHEPPRSPVDTSSCLMDEKRVDACGFPAPPESPDMEAVKQVRGVEVLDLYSEVCGPRVCSPVVDGMVVYRDSTHMTLTYARSRVPVFLQLLDAV
jgi:SGNH domain (fused to AT3 domains)